MHVGDCHELDTLRGGSFCRHRLRIQLLASWTESVKKTQKLLLESLNGQVRYLAGEWVKTFTTLLATILQLG